MLLTPLYPEEYLDGEKYYFNKDHADLKTILEEIRTKIGIDCPIDCIIIFSEDSENDSCNRQTIGYYIKIHNPKFEKQLEKYKLDLKKYEEEKREREKREKITSLKLQIDMCENASKKLADMKKELNKLTKSCY